LVELLFSTLNSIQKSSGDPTQNEQVGYAVCQGWLDIMIQSTCMATPKKFEKESDKWSVYSSLDAQSVGKLLSEATKYLMVNLNLGNFEGPSGANQLVVRRLTLV